MPFTRSQLPQNSSPSPRAPSPGRVGREYRSDAVRHDVDLASGFHPRQRVLPIPFVQQQQPIREPRRGFDLRQPRHRIPDAPRPSLSRQARVVVVDHAAVVQLLEPVQRQTRACVCSRRTSSGRRTTVLRRWRRPSRHSTPRPCGARSRCRAPWRHELADLSDGARRSRRRRRCRSDGRAPGTPPAACRTPSRSPAWGRTDSRRRAGSTGSRGPAGDPRSTAIVCALRNDAR